MSMRSWWLRTPVLGLLAAAAFVACSEGTSTDAKGDGLHDDLSFEPYRNVGEDAAYDGSAYRNEPEVMRQQATIANVPQGAPAVPTLGCGTPGTANFCSSPSCLCGAGEGDCDSDAECSAGHSCAQDVGASYGFSTLTDVCVAWPGCHDTIAGRPTFCTASCKCSDGEGDCDSDDECATGTQCAKDVGADYGYAPLVDVCVAVDSCSHTIPGRATMCSSSCPCEAGEGDCDNDGECGTGLVCGTDVGADYGFGPLVDVCVPEPDPCAHRGDAEPSAMTGMTAAHNQERCNVDASTALPPLSWSSTVASTAQDWADYLASEGCPMQHSGGEYGENIYWTSGSASPQDVVDYWASEESCFTYGTFPGCCSCTCGHYTQIAWRNSAELGCGMASCAGGGQIWVCNYDPPGNYIGQYPY